MPLPNLNSWKLTLAVLGAWSVALPAKAETPVAATSATPQTTAVQTLSPGTLGPATATGESLLSGNLEGGLQLSPFDPSANPLTLGTETFDAPLLEQFTLSIESPQGAPGLRLEQRPDQSTTLYFPSQRPDPGATESLRRAAGPENANPLSPEPPQPSIDNLDQTIPEPLAPNFGESDEPTLELFPVGEPRIPADDRSILDIAGRVLTPEGTPLDGDVVVTLTTSAGEFIGADYDTDRAGFQVLARRGAFEVRLKSSLSAQSVRLRAAVDGREARGLDPATTSEQYPELEAYTTVEFTTYLRPSLVSGVVDLRLGPGGADFWDSFRNYLNPGQIGDTEIDIDAAVFATGALGEWLFTGAFNSDRALNERCDGNRLYRDVQFCEQTYPVYGDSSEIDYLTPSIDSFYARLQRDAIQPGAEPDYVMWGDYDTLEFSRASQEFTATVRQLHGFKGNYNLGPLQVTAMYANNLQPFQRDTIVPDGTSGYYFLSKRLVLPGSEDIFIETVELNRPGTVIDRVRLVRGIDYEIDYDRGSILFRQPILAIDVNPLGVTLTRRIVATYQVENTEGGGDLYAGRLQYNFTYGFEEASWLGATLLTQDEGLQDFTLVGADFMTPLGETGEVVGEFAYSSFSLPGLNQDGAAYRLEASGELFENVVGQAYLRSAETGFRNTATASFRPGQTRYGAGITAGLGPDTQVYARYDHESNRGPTPAVLTSASALLLPGQEPVLGPDVDNSLNTYNLGIEQQIGTATLGLDWVNRDYRDRIAADGQNAHQLIPRLSIPLGANITFKAQSDINLSSDVVPLYPSRTVFGVDWEVEPGVTIRLAQQFISGGGGFQPGSVTSLDAITDYALDENTSLTSRYSILGGYNGLTGQGALGLNHRIRLAPGLRATLAFERIFADAFNDTPSGQQFLQPYAVGSGATALGLQAGTAYSVGLEYTDNPDFQASTRFEYRDSSAGSNLVFSAAAAGKLSEALTVLGRYQQGNYANQFITGQLGDTINLKLGMAYRNPFSDQFNGLLSYEYRQNPALTPDTILNGLGSGSNDHTLALEGIYAPNWQWEFYGKYALRYNQSNLADNFNFSSTIHLGQLRAAYRFAYQWDVLGEMRWIGQPSANFSELGFALEVGYYLTSDLRIGVGYSFGSANDTSFGGSGYRSASGPYLGVTFKVNELINGFGLQTVAPPQQTESYVSPEPAGDAPSAAPSPSPEAPGTPPPGENTLPLLESTAPELEGAWQA